MADKNFTILMKRAPDYKIIPCGTVYGGPLPDASGIMMNICVDHTAFPNYVTHEVDSEGRVNAQNIIDQVQIANMEREMLCGIVLTLDQAKRMANWLNSHIDKIEGTSNE